MEDQMSKPSSMINLVAHTAVSIFHCYSHDHKVLTSHRGSTPNFLNENGCQHSFSKPSWINLCNHSSHMNLAVCINKTLPRQNHHTSTPAFFCISRKRMNQKFNSSCTSRLIRNVEAAVHLLKTPTLPRAQ